MPLNKYNQKRHIVKGSIIRIPPPEESIVELLLPKYINCFAALHQIRCINNNALFIIQELIRNNQELLLLNEIKEYSFLVTGIDMSLSLIPYVGQIKAIIEIRMGKNITHYIMYEKMKNIPVSNFAGIDYAQNLVDAIVPGIKIVNGTSRIINLTEAQIEIIEISGNVNALVNTARTNLGQIKTVKQNGN